MSETKAREWWIARPKVHEWGCDESFIADRDPAQLEEFWRDWFDPEKTVHVVEFSRLREAEAERDAVIKAHDENITICKDLQKLLKECQPEIERDLTKKALALAIEQRNALLERNYKPHHRDVQIAEHDQAINEILSPSDSKE